jgi:hypothetical protein
MIISIHEYSLRKGKSTAQLEKSFKEAEEMDLFQLPGLKSYFLLKGIRGKRKNAFAVIWIYENLQKWEALWGPLDQPFSKEKYPEKWKIWEDEILAPLLDREPDKIDFTTYRAFAGFEL